MKTFIAVLFGMFATFVAAGSAHASMATGTIRWISMDLNTGSGNIVFVKMDVAPPGKPACATNPNADYLFDASTTAGKNFYAYILAAYMSQREVKLSGYDTCSLNSAEDLRWVAGP